MKKNESLQLDLFIQPILHGSRSSRFKYKYFPWPLWQENIAEPDIKSIHEPKLPYTHAATLQRSLQFLELSIDATDLTILESISPKKTHIVYQSKIRPNRILKATFNNNPDNNLFHAHQLICLIMGTSAYNNYLSTLK